jgi:hypothetical protein
MKKHAGGRPSKGLSEVRVEVPMSAELRDGAREFARLEDVTLAEFVRRAIGDRIDKLRAMKARLVAARRAK